MEKGQKVQSEKLKRNKKKKHLLHYLIVYLVCLLVACVTWLSVRYSMRAEENKQAEGDCASLSSFLPVEQEETLYV